MADASPGPVRRRATLAEARAYEVLAAQNATLRLRATSGYVFSFTDLTSAHGAVNFGHLNPAIDAFSLASDLIASHYPPSATSHAEWLQHKLGLAAHTVLYEVSEDAMISKAIAMARRCRPGKTLMIDGSAHSAANRTSISRAHTNSFRADSSESIQRIGVGTEFEAWEDISCLLYEPVPAASGFMPLPLPWLRALSQSARNAGVVVVANEIESGFFRFGKLSLAASEYLRPDFYLFGNSMTNGVYPLFAMVYSEAIESAPAPGDIGWKSTFQTASIGFQAAEAVARYIDSNSIDDQIAEIHFQLSCAGERLAANPRLTAFHLAGPTLSLEVRDGRAERLLHACEKRGILIGAIGRRAVIAPPVTIPMDHLTRALKVVEQAAATL